MSHPLKSEAADAHASKLRAMTSHYGAASGPANNIASPQARLKGEAGEPHVGFGADSDNASAKRGDRPARTSMAANPLPTYARGGKVKHRADGGESTDAEAMMKQRAANTYKTMKDPIEKARGGKVRHRDDGGSVSPIEAANKAEGEAEASEKNAGGGVIARARGGRTAKGKHGTHVNVIVAPQGAGGPPPGAGPSPQLAALAAGAHPPMGGPPMPPPGAGGPPPGGPPMMPPGGPGGPPPGMPMRARGGKVMGDHPDAAQDKDLIQKTLREEGLVRKAKGGGITMTAGALTGEGRLEKMGKKVHPLTKSDAQEV
jgi:hypothetical protein